MAREVSPKTGCSTSREAGCRENAQEGAAAGGWHLPAAAPCRSFAGDDLFDTVFKNALGNKNGGEGYEINMHAVRMVDSYGHRSRIDRGCDGSRCRRI